MSEPIHGHEVMKMMIESNKTYTKAALEEEIIGKFGSDARFYTCSAENMTAKEIVEFLDSKGKFIESDDGFSTDPGQICDH